MQRGRIIAATIEAAAELSYQRLSVAAIISRARLSRRTFYESFSDREDCVLATFEWASEQLLSVMREGYSQETSWITGVRSALGRVFALMDEEPDMARFLLIVTPRAGEEVAYSRVRLYAQIAETIDEGRLAPGAHGDPPQITALGIVGSISNLLRLRLLQGSDDAIDHSLGPLMYLIVLPYLGPAAARRELHTPPTRSPSTRRAPAAESVSSSERVNTRITYRTIRVLTVIAECPGASNREVARDGGITDQGQISKLLKRLERLGLVENRGLGQHMGLANAWHLTVQGSEVARNWGSWLVVGRADESLGGGGSVLARAPRQVP